MMLVVYIQLTVCALIVSGGPVIPDITWEETNGLPEDEYDKVSWEEGLLPEEEVKVPKNGTDQGLFNLGYFEGDIVLKPGLKNAVADPNLLWPYGAIVYKVAEDVGCPDSLQCEILMKAMDHYHRKSCVRFKEWTGEPNYVKVFFNPDSGACWSPVGRTGDGEQLLSLGERCWYLGIVIHELGHAVGFWHEMNRPDRDNWITVYWNNIISGFSSAFDKHDSKSVDTLGEKFDYKSIMMYDEYAFSKDYVSPTIIPKVPGVVIGPIWQKTGLSDSDIRRLHKLYKCQGHHPKAGFPYDITCNFNYDTCGFNNGGSATWQWENVNSTDGYVYSSSLSMGYLVSSSFHPLAEGDKRGPLGCVRFWYNVPAGGSLKILQMYMRSVTQLTYGTSKEVIIWEGAGNLSPSEWAHIEVPLYVTRPFKLIFLSRSGSGAIAIDDFELHYTPCSSSTSTTHNNPHTTTMTTKPVSVSTIKPYVTSKLTTKLSTTQKFTWKPVTTTTKPSTLSSIKPKPHISFILKPKPVILSAIKPAIPAKPDSVTIFPTNFMDFKKINLKKQEGESFHNSM